MTTRAKVLYNMVASRNLDFKDVPKEISEEVKSFILERQEDFLLTLENNSIGEDDEN